MTLDRLRQWQKDNPERMRKYWRTYRKKHKATLWKPSKELMKIYHENYTLKLIQRYHSGEQLSLWSIDKIKSRLTGTYKPRKVKT